MPETVAADRRPALLICNYDASDDDWDLVENLAGDLWSPAGARTIAVPAAAPDALASALSDYLRDHTCRGLLLVGRNRRGDGFRVQMRAENRGLSGPGRLDPTGPGVARSTAPVADMVQALTEAGFAADASSEAEEDVGSYLLYRVLNELGDAFDAPAVGLLRAPEPAEGDAVRAGVQVAAAAMARRLPPLPRAA